MSTEEAVLSGQCDCGAVRFELSARPKWLVDCNCAYCGRIQALWANLPLDEVRLSYTPEAVFRYARADRILDFVVCRTCGCCTHWEHRDAQSYGRISVNCTMVAPALIADIPIRAFDGAGKFGYIEGEPTREAWHRA